MAQAPDGLATEGLQQICRRAFVVSGLLAFVISLVPLVVRPGATGTAVLIWLLALVAWTGAFAVRAELVRSVLQLLVLLLLVLLPVALPVSTGADWLPVAIIALCASAGAVLVLPLAPGLLVTAISVTMVVIVTAVGATEGLQTAVSRQAPWLPPLFIACIAGGLALTRHYAARLTREADRVARRSDEVTVLTVRAARAAQARATVDRRIHETVLNTLSAIAAGGVSSERLRRECRRDLEQMQLGFMPQAEPGLADIVRSALQVVGGLEARVVVDVVDAIDLDPGPAGAMRDALVEALRNVERHSGATSVEVTAGRHGESARVRVTDDGIGMREDVHERFGVRNSIRSSLAALGGGAVLESAPGGGTSVLLEVPARIRPPRMPVPTEIPPGDRFAGRLGLLGPVIAAVAAFPFILGGLPGPWVPLIGMSLFGILCVLLAWLPADEARRRLARVIVGLGALLVVVTAVEVGDCTAAPVVGCVIVAVIGSLFLVTVDVGSGVRARALSTVLLVIAPLLLIWRLPDDCRAVALVTWAVMTVFVLGMIAMILTTVRSLTAAEGRRADAEAARREADLQLAESIASRAAWGKVTGTTKEVLASIADGTVDPADDFVRDRARIEESKLRARLGSLAPNGLWRAVVDAAEQAALAGRSVDLGSVGSGGEARVAPAEARALLADIIATAPTGRVSARVLYVDGVEELVVTAPRAQVIERVTRFASDEVQAEIIPGGLEDADAQVILTWRRAAADSG